MDNPAPRAAPKDHEMHSHVQEQGRDTAHLVDGYVERFVPGNAGLRADLVAHLQRYKFAGQYVAGRRVLDAACGTGYGSRLLALSGAVSVDAADFSEEAIAVARDSFAHPAVRHVVADCESLDGVTGPFGAVIALEMIEHLRDRQSFLANVTSVLQSDGIFICSTPNGLGEAVAPGNPHHVVEYSAAQFESLLHEYFHTVQLYGQQWSAASRAINVLWSNPAVRIGRWLQTVFRGHRADKYLWSQFVPTEADIVISDLNVDIAWTLIAVCSGPIRTT